MKSKKPKKPVGKKPTMFETLFLGKLVQLVLKSKTTQTETTEDSVGSSESCITISGILAGEDMRFYFICGEDTTAAVDKNEVLYLALVPEEKTEHDQLLDDLGDDPSPEQVN